MVAKEIVEEIQEACDKILVCGSLRRRKLKVGDVEIVYVPKLVDFKVDLLDTKKISAVDMMLEQLIANGLIAKRKNVNGSEVWGEKNKLAVHRKTGIPVDFFSTREECWWNYVVCRTGGAINNTRIAQAYQKHRCKWNPYGPGYSTSKGEEIRNATEADVYENCGLRYLHPWERP